MIRTEMEYQTAVKQLVEEQKLLKDWQAKLEETNVPHDQIKREMDPMRSFHQQLKEEVESYEKLKRGEFEEVRNFEGLGTLLIALRIAMGVSQRELAQRLGVHESQVSRDERNDYHGITVERAGRILDALGVDVRTTVEPLKVRALAT